MSVTLRINGQNAKAIQHTLTQTQHKPSLSVGEKTFPNLSRIGLSLSVSGLVLGVSFYNDKGQFLHEMGIDDYDFRYEVTLKVTPSFNALVTKEIKRSQESTYQPILVALPEIA